MENLAAISNDTGRKPLHYSVVKIGPCQLIISKKQAFTYFTLLCAVCLLAAYSVTVGKLNIGFNEVWSIISGEVSQGFKQRVVMNIRLPRITTALFVGAALGVSGAIFQSLSRNALGSPDIIGFTTGAASGAIAQIVLFEQSGFAVSVSAIGGGLATAVIVYLLSRQYGRVGGYRLILIGIGVGSILSALNSLMLVKGHIDSAITANLWLAGSLHARTWQHALPVLAGVVLLIPAATYFARRLSLIEMGDDLAKQLGVNVETTRLLMLFIAVILAALATGAAGPISFIALAAPQLIARLIGGGQILIIGSALMGAILLISADLISQLLPFDFSLPIGTMTGLIGGVYLLFLLAQRRDL